MLLLLSYCTWGGGGWPVPLYFYKGGWGIPLCGYKGRGECSLVRLQGEGGVIPYAPFPIPKSCCCFPMARGGGVREGGRAAPKAGLRSGLRAARCEVALFRLLALRIP